MQNGNASAILQYLRVEVEDIKVNISQNGCFNLNFKIWKGIIKLLLGSETINCKGLVSMIKSGP